MTVIRRVALGTWSPPPVYGSAEAQSVDRHLHDGAERYRREIAERQKRLNDQRALRARTYASASEVVGRVVAQRAIVTYPSGHMPYDDGVIHVALAKEGLEKKIVGELRVAIIVRPHVDAQFARVEGLALRGQHFPGKALEKTGEIIFASKLAEFVEVIWADIFDEGLVADAVSVWLSKVYAKYFDETEDLYERRLAEVATELDALAQGRDPQFSVRILDSRDSVAFTTSESRRFAPR
jgi:hypothetical protein